MRLRGDRFREYKSNVFICEPTANLIKREIITEMASRSAKSAYDKEVFSSTDERFRPVNLYTAPDGTLYIVDLYRGILQHQIYLTTYLKNQSLARQLDKGNGLGRIYRVVADGKKPGAKPQMSKDSSADLVKYLSHPNGWWRDTAQRLLIERNDDSVISELRKIASSPDAEGSLGRLHALWTLEGMNALDAPTPSPLDLVQKSGARAARRRIDPPPPMEPGQTQPAIKPPQDARRNQTRREEYRRRRAPQLIFTMGGR
jgi:hypothetical protein